MTAVKLSSSLLIVRVMNFDLENDFPSQLLNKHKSIEDFIYKVFNRIIVVVHDGSCEKVYM